jgi:hypothetical protein
MSACPPSPPDLRAVIRHGLVCDGRLVARVVPFDADGRPIADLSVPPPAPPDLAKTAWGEAILALLRDSPHPLSPRQVAEGTGYAWCGGFRDRLVRLAAHGLIAADGDGFLRLANPRPG